MDSLINDISGLTELLEDPNEVAMREQQAKGSVLNPGSIGGGDNKEVAKPFTKVTATINNRNITTNQSKQENVIWEKEEIKDFVKEKNETRPTPDYECIYKQNVGATDVYGMLSDIDPSSECCQEILLKI